jgi:hypothetical protein
MAAEIAALPDVSECRPILEQLASKRSKRDPAIQIGPNVQLLTATHPIKPGLRLDKWEAAEPDRDHGQCLVGGGVIVGPGVTRTPSSARAP